ITELQRTIYAGQTGATPQAIPLADANNARKSRKLQGPPGEEPPPPRPPHLVVPGSADASCAEFRDARSQPGITVVGGAPELTSGIPTTGSLATGTSLADRIAIPSGRVALVRAMASASAPTGAYLLVTDLGMRYPVASNQALQALGYPEAKAIDMPAGLVNRIPPGPTLDPVAAQQPVEPRPRQTT